MRIHVKDEDLSGLGPGHASTTGGHDCAGVVRGEPPAIPAERRLDLACDALWRAEAPDRPLDARAPNELGLVFPTPNGSVWRKDNFMARVFRPAVGRAQLEPLRFHDLRHTYAALMVAAGAHPKLLQAQLGHTSINVTLNTYGHLFPDAFADVGDALDRLVRGAAARAS
jgi:integrase